MEYIVREGARGESMPDFREIYEEFHPRILRYLSRMAGEEAAEDVAQETFARIDRGLRDFRGESSLLVRKRSNPAIRI